MIVLNIISVNKRNSNVQRFHGDKSIKVPECVCSQNRFFIKESRYN